MLAISPFLALARKLPTILALVKMHLLLSQQVQTTAPWVPMPWFQSILVLTMWRLATTLADILLMVQQL